MFSRRRFLGYSSAGIVSLSAACQPPALRRSAFGGETVATRPKTGESLTDLKDRMLGYPINMNTPPEEFFAWRDELFEAGIDQFAFNNVGNPFQESPIPYNSHDYERKTILAFADRYRFPADDTWGFLSHSGTDSNMHGMYMGRTLLQGRTGRLPKAYFTREAHYSVQILRDLLGIDGVTVATTADGGMDPNDLAAKLQANSAQPALVVATVGTTFKGAIDDVDLIQQALGKHPHYVHVDAALFGGYLPFTCHRDEVAYATDSHTKGRYDSIAVSCHKFFGFPSPAGLFITRLALYEEFNQLFSQIHNPEYIHHVPGTITCSRDGVKPAEFYYFTRPQAVSQQVNDAQLMLDNAQYLHTELRNSFPRLDAQRANELSNTVYFRCPQEDMVHKYSLATMHLEFGGQANDYAHVVVMPHATREVLDEFLEAL